VSGQLNYPASLNSGQRTLSTHLKGGWAGPRTGLDVGWVENPVVFAGIQTALSHFSAHSLVTILTELSQLHAVYLPIM